MNRREFLAKMAAGAVMVLEGSPGKSGAVVKPEQSAKKTAKTRLSLVKTRDRATGIRRAVDLLGMNPVAGKNVLLKPNFNSADPFPASTHNDTLIQLINQLRNMGSQSITVGERSGLPRIGDVFKQKGIYEICAQHGIGAVRFEDLPESDWVRIQPEKSHWVNGFDIARPVLESSCVVTTCCLKTHGSGGVFSMSLKLSVGCLRDANMIELHMSLFNIQKMIAEINQAYQPSLIVLDALDAFVDKGPTYGPVKRPDVILAGTDRIAIDAVGLSILKELGSNKAIMNRKIFEQEQIARAVELGLGVASPEDIEIITDDSAGTEYAEKLMGILRRG